MLQCNKTATGPVTPPLNTMENAMMTPEQVLATHKANIEILFGLTNKAFEGVEKIVELNLQTAKTSLSEAADTTRAALAVKDAQELFALQAGLLQPAAETQLEPDVCSPRSPAR